MKWDDVRVFLRKFWHFIWEDNSIWSWIANVVLAFVLIKFIVYPLLGFLLGTTHPIVAVVSGSMEHQGSFDNWWTSQESLYAEKGITKDTFKSFRFVNGFNKGDIIILTGEQKKDIQVGDVIVFSANLADPIIHRVVKKWEENNTIHFQTKGDFNHGFANVGEQDIIGSRVIGRALFRIPLVGYVKIAFVSLIDAVRGG